MTVLKVVPAWSLTLLLALSPANSTVRAGSEQQEKPQGDRERLQGTWECVATLKDGKEVLAYVGVRAVIKGNDLTWFFPRKDGSYRETQNQFRIDPAKDPKHFDWWPVKGEKASIPDLRLYAIEGDTLRWPTNLDYKTRPKTFDSALWQFTMQRVREAK